MIKLFDDWVIIPGPCDYALAKNLGEVERKSARDAKNKFKYIGYYSDVAGCLKRLGEELTRERLKDGTHTLREAVTIIRESNARVEKLLKEVLANDDLK